METHNINGIILQLNCRNRNDVSNNTYVISSFHFKFRGVVGFLVVVTIMLLSFSGIEQVKRFMKIDSLSKGSHLEILKSDVLYSKSVHNKNIYGFIVRGVSCVAKEICRWNIFASLLLFFFFFDFISAIT